jgi:hypothetical protein
MYHLGGDFAGGLLLWTVGALAAAALTGSRSALAVALAAACAWSGMRVQELAVPHPHFLIVWLSAATLALAWNTPWARHLVALSAIAGAVMTGYAVEHGSIANPTFTFLSIVSCIVGAGLVLATRSGESERTFGLTLSTYGAFGLAIGLAFAVAEGLRLTKLGLPLWIIGTGAAAPLLAFAAAAMAKRPGPALAGISILLSLVVASGLIPTGAANDPWLSYALALTAMLSLVVSGMLDDVRPRVAAGWIGLAATIAAITWAVRGSLLRRAVFLAISGLVAVALASLLGRLLGKERRR